VLIVGKLNVKKSEKVITQPGMRQQVQGETVLPKFSFLSPASTAFPANIPATPAAILAAISLYPQSRQN
jgi:hypothetical protein